MAIPCSGCQLVTAQPADVAGETGPAHVDRRVVIGAAAAAAFIMLIVLVTVVSRGGDGRSAARNHAPSTGSAGTPSQASQPSPADSTTVTAGSKPPGSLLGTYRHISRPDDYGISFTDDPTHPRQHYQGDLQYSAGMVEARNFMGFDLTVWQGTPSATENP
ncbi:hypothetical protein NE236_24760 [Actinoallomurus purpureus]|uniref:hypothetical protein n=1 Tax=Actinoallomurus purpureus TaxID=478114 RepID=UPI002092769E|nr:hypothetical protein [Actinoallomurus purpureus]MCO6008195.1 hypothetical protein [Actinoallomurus purpureus]